MVRDPDALDIMDRDLSEFMPLSVYERPDVSLANLLSGEPKAAAQALLYPNTLSPSQLKKLKDKFGSGGKHDPILNTILSISTNPLFLIGMALSLKFPAPSAKNLYKMATTIKNTGTAPFFSRIASPFRLFHQAGKKGGKPIWQLMMDVTDEVLGIKLPYGRAVDKAATRFQKLSGRPMGPNDWELVLMKLDGLDKPGGHLNTALREVAKGRKIPPLMKPINEAAGFTGAHKAAHDILRGDVFENFLAKVRGKLGVSPAAHKRLSQAISRRFGWEAQAPGVYSKVPWYMPHMPANSKWSSLDVAQRAAAQDREEMVRLAKFIEGGPKTAAKKAVAGMGTAEVSPRGIKRVTLGMMPERRILKKWGHLVNDEAHRVLYEAGGARKQEILQQTNALISGYGRAPASRAWRLQMKGVLGKSARLSDNQITKALDEVEPLAARARTRPQAKKAMAKYIDEMGNMPEYRVDSNVVPDYINQVAPEWAWVVNGNGDKVLEATSRLDTYRKYLMESAYIPLLRGRRTAKQNAWAIKWAGREARFGKWLDQGSTKKLFAGMGADNVRTWMRDRLLSPGARHAQSISGKVSSYFYTTTLGLNISPAMKNLMQTFITTAPLMGPGVVFKGFGQVLKRIPAYAKARKAGLSEYDAMKKAYPEFIGANLEPAPLAEMMKHGAIGTEAALPALKTTATKAGRVTGTLKDWMMKLFSTTEKTNRLVTFYGTRDKALAERMSAGAASSLGRMVTARTQFTAGVSGMPPALVNLPGPYRQFMYFPLRFLDFMMSPRSMGGGLGMLGRTAALSTAGTIAGRNLAGVDLSGGLLEGALPMPAFQGMPFYPMPLVPPLFGLAGGLFKGIAQGGPQGKETLGRALSLAVPGGIAIRRAVKTLSPEYADYEGKLPDGRIPVYNDNGSLMGAYRPMQLYLKAAGFKPHDMQAEQAMTVYLLKQRDQIRSYRREYVEALGAGEYEQAEEIKAEFSRKYPELGALRVKKSDLQAMETRKMLTRIGRVIRGIRKEHKPIFRGMAHMALANDIVERVHTQPQSLRIIAGLLNQSEERGMASRVLGAMSGVSPQGGYGGHAALNPALGTGRLPSAIGGAVNPLTMGTR